MLDIFENYGSFKVDDNYIGFGFYLANQYPNLARLIYAMAFEFERDIDRDFELVFTSSFLTEEEINKYEKEFVEGTALDYIDLLTRESIYELYRRLHYPELNSRYNSLFLTDKNGIEYWKSILVNHDLYELEVSGKYFKTDSELLSSSFLPPFLVHELAKDYWNPSEIEDDRAEYLFQGDVKVLRKI